VKKFKYLYWKYRIFSNHIKGAVNKLLRVILEPLGISLFSKAARGSIDDKLAAYLPNSGVFIEVGATDGYTESNTYYLERFKNWTGVLIEPIPDLYKKCVKERPRSQVFNCALVSDDYPNDAVVMKEGYLMSTVKGALGSDENAHLEKARYFHGTDALEISVPARTLTSVLKEAGVTDIDFFSLDVEGYEVNVLQGLDLDTYRPTFMLVECLDDSKKKEIEKHLGNKYEFIKKVGKREFLYKRRNVRS
jgi:FkbM family methyltransferase